MLNAEGVPTVVSRAGGAAGTNQGLLVITPDSGTDGEDLKDLRIYPPPAPGKADQKGEAPVTAQPTLIVLPKWLAIPDPTHKGWVRKLEPAQPSDIVGQLLKGFDPKTGLQRRKGVTRPQLHGAPGPFAGDLLQLGAVDSLQTISGRGWTPLLVDEAGRAVLVASADRMVFVLSDPDLLNTQGLADLNTARAGLGIVNALRPDQSGVVFDVSLNGFKRGRSLLRLMLEPPFLGATLCAALAAILTGLHALVRFGPPLQRGRAVALGKAALVDNSAGLIRMSGKEAQLAPAYAEQAQALAARAVGARAAGGPERTEQLSRLGQAKRSSLDLKDLIGEAARARSRADLLACARRLHQWRLEITRERE
jgi:hypothetical protein